MGVANIVLILVLALALIDLALIILLFWRYNDLKKEVNGLDPKKIAETLTNEINGFRETTGNIIKDLEDAITSRVNEQDEKIEKFISSSRKATIIVTERIFTLVKEHLIKLDTKTLMGEIKKTLKEIFGGEKPEETKSDDSTDEESAE